MTSTNIFQCMRPIYKLSEILSLEYLVWDDVTQKLSPKKSIFKCKQQIFFCFLYFLMIYDAIPNGNFSNYTYREMIYTWECICNFTFCLLMWIYSYFIQEEMIRLYELIADVEDCFKLFDIRLERRTVENYGKWSLIAQVFTYFTTLPIITFIFVSRMFRKQLVLKYVATVSALNKLSHMGVVLCRLMDRIFILNQMLESMQKVGNIKPRNTNRIVETVKQIRIIYQKMLKVYNLWTKTSSFPIMLMTLLVCEELMIDLLFWIQVIFLHVEIPVSYLQVYLAIFIILVVMVTVTTGVSDHVTQECAKIPRNLHRVYLTAPLKEKLREEIASFSFYMINKKFIFNIFHIYNITFSTLADVSNILI